MKHLQKRKLTHSFPHFFFNFGVFIFLGETGHIARECSQVKSAPDTCYNCGQPGHIARECGKGGSTEGFSSAVAPQSFGGRGQKCYTCGKLGHIARECMSGQASGGMSGQACYNCGTNSNFIPNTGPKMKTHGLIFLGKFGHLSRDCYHGRPGGALGGFQQQAAAGNSCYNCGRPGHISRDCRRVRPMSRAPIMPTQTGHCARILACPTVFC